MTRSKIREHIFCILFRNDFHSRDEMREQSNLYLDELQGITDDERAYILKKTSEIVDLLDEIDTELNSAVVGWKTQRMAKSDLTVLRLAYYEIKNEDDIPEKVSINEAVNLAKKYGTNNSQSFVNGVLARIVG